MHEKILAEMAKRGYTWERAEPLEHICGGCVLRNCRGHECPNHPDHLAIARLVDCDNWCSAFFLIEPALAKMRWVRRTAHLYPET